MSKPEEDLINPVEVVTADDIAKDYAETIPDENFVLELRQLSAQRDALKPPVDPNAEERRLIELKINAVRMRLAEITGQLF